MMLYLACSVLCRYNGVSTSRTYTGSDGNNVKNSLFISELNDSHVNKTVDKSHQQKNSDQLERNKVSRRLKRDASTMCKVVTRDVGILHAARVRSVGVMANLLPPPPPAPVDRDVKEKSPIRDLKRPSLGNLFTATRSTQTIEDKIDAKTKLLSTLSRQNSSIINRMAEVQNEAPALTFDNSTNTDAVHCRNISCNTDQLRTREQKTNTTLSSQQVMSKDEFDSEVNQKVKSRVNEQVERAKMNWDLQLEEMLQERLKIEMINIEDKYKVEFEQELEIRVNDKVKSELARAKQSIEQDISDEVDSRVTDEVARAKQRWEANLQATTPVKPLTRDRFVQVDEPKESKPEVKIEKPSARTVAAGEGKTNDILCDKCILPKKSIGCSWDKVTDIVCDKCEETRQALSLRPITKSTSIQTTPVVSKVNTSASQTTTLAFRTTSTNTTFLALRKEEPVINAASPVLTPELERRPFGSSGVNICDKCHDTITSVAKDIVGTSIASATLSSGPVVIVPLPPTSGPSKIPRLMDPFKLEPRLETEEPSLSHRDSEMRRSDSRIDHLSSDVAQLRRRQDQTPDLLSDSAIARDNRRNSGPSAIDTEKQKVPLYRQQTYTKLQDGKDGSSESNKSPRKMSAFDEVDESLAGGGDSNSRKSSSILPMKAKVNVYRRERSSPEIGLTSSWKRQQAPVGDERKVEKPESGTADSWQKEMTSYSEDRTSRSTSVESNATYKIVDGMRKNR